MNADLQRFIEAQQPLYEQVRRELADGTKHSHWMWFIFPQLAQLGHSPTARHFGIVDAAHARAYLTDALLGERLRECVRLACAHPGRSAQQIFGYPDVLKFRSSLTLFNTVAGEERIFAEALRQFYQGQADELTLRLLQAG